MSDWNRGREEDQRRYRTDERRDWATRSRWPDPERREPRSFEDRGRTGYESRADDRYQGSASGYGGYAARRAGEPYGRQDERSERYGAYGGRGYLAGYGEPSYGEAAYGDPRGYGYGARQAYGEDRWRGEAQRSEFIGDNEAVRHVTEGEADRPSLMHGRGEHRGRGPKNYTRSDERIREDVNDRLSDDAWLDASEIEVQVSACEVTLNGTVQSREDRRRAEDIAEDVSGVKHVQNNLRVEASTQGRSSSITGANAGSSRNVAGQPSPAQARGGGSSPLS